MIIGIDISSIPYGTGVSSYTLNLVKYLIKNDSSNIYKLFFSSLRQKLSPEIKKLKKKYKNVKIYHYRLPPTFFEYIWHHLHILPIELFIGKCDIFHTWDWLEPPTRHAKTITTIHDLVPILYPKWQHQKTISNFKTKLKLASQCASAFICVSQNTKLDLKKLYPQINPDKIFVVYEAAEDKYRCFQKLSPSIKNQKIEKIKKLYDLNEYILAQGTREPRKNLKRLIEAFILFKRQNPSTNIELVIGGKYGWGNDVSHLRHPYIKILGYIPEKDMVALHAAALALAYPSLYEGFGLPLVKAMSLGIPIVTSKTSSLPEVVGNAAILVNPNSTSNIQNALTKIIKSEKLRQKLIKRGLLQAQKFSWDLTAQKTLKIYQKIL